MLLSNCASFSDVEHLQAQLNALQPKITNLSAKASSAKTSAQQALTIATEASSKAQRSAHYLQDTFEKLTPHICRLPRPIRHTIKNKSRKH
ncbi:alanine-zipper protein [Methylocucumis oryzae]